MSTRRVAVTGLGVICALGHNTSETWNAICEGRSGIAPIHSIDVSKLRFRYGAQVCQYAPSKYFEANHARLLDPFSQFAIIAAREAMKDSGITLTPALCEKAAIVTGSGMGGQSTQDVGFAKLYQRNQGRVDPLIIPRAMANAGASHISWSLASRGQPTRSPRLVVPRTMPSVKPSGWFAMALWNWP